VAAEAEQGPEAVMAAGAPQAVLAAAGVERGQEALPELGPGPAPAGWGVSAPVPAPRSALAPMRRLGPVRTLRSAPAPMRRQPLEPIPVPVREKGRPSVTVRATAPETRG